MVLPKSIWKRQLKSYWKTRSASSLWREPQIISGFGSRITGLSTRLKETKFGCCSCGKETKFTANCRKHFARFFFAELMPALAVEHALAVFRHHYRKPVFFQALRARCLALKNHFTNPSANRFFLMGLRTPESSLTFPPAFVPAACPT